MSIELTLRRIAPCTTTKKRIKVKAGISRDITEMFPYINAVIPSAIYNKHADWLTFRMGEKVFTFYPKKMWITKLMNETDAYEMLDFVQDKLNEIDDNRENIVPNYEMKKMPTHLEIFKMLPKKNGCNLCGAFGCLAYARELLSGEVSLDACPILKEKEYEQQFDSLESTLQSFGLIE